MSIEKIASAYPHRKATNDNYFEEMTYKFEFTLKEVSMLVSAVIHAQVDDEQFIKNYPENKELVENLEKEKDMLQAILDKLRDPA